MILGALIVLMVLMVLLCPNYISRGYYNRLKPKFKERFKVFFSKDSKKRVMLKTLLLNECLNIEIFFVQERYSNT